MARYQPGLRTEARIIAATGELLAEFGLEGTTLKAICDRAGIKSGSFYNLFDSKDEAVLRVVREAITAVDPHPEGEGPDTVAELVGAYVRFVTEQPTVARIYLQIAVHGGLTDSSMAARFLRHHEQRVRRFAAAMSRDTEPGRRGAGPSRGPAGGVERSRLPLGAPPRLRLRRPCRHHPGDGRAGSSGPEALTRTG